MNNDPGHLITRYEHVAMRDVYPSMAWRVLCSRFMRAARVSDSDELCWELQARALDCFRRAELATLWNTKRHQRWAHGEAPILMPEIVLVVVSREPREPAQRDSEPLVN